VLNNNGNTQKWRVNASAGRSFTATVTYTPQADGSRKFSIDCGNGTNRSGVVPGGNCADPCDQCSYALRR
jgi:hypothetical protein